MSESNRPEHANQGESESRQDSTRLAPARRVLAVAGGKGGVGKSTVAVNLALGLDRLGYRVGLLDADVHGPNVPLMLGVRRRADVSGWESIVPLAAVSPPASALPALERYGLRVMSLGLLAGEAQSILTGNAALAGILVYGLLAQVDWGHPDVLIIDLPPGTGEPLPTLLERVQVDGVVVITTPQEVARLDAGRAMAAFRTADVPILGVVENMAYATCPRCGERIDVFHRGPAAKSVAAHAPSLLAQIPLDPVLSEAADTGRPVLVVEPDGPQAAAFLALAAAVAERLGLVTTHPGDE